MSSTELREFCKGPCTNARGEKNGEMEFIDGLLWQQSGFTPDGIGSEDASFPNNYTR